MKENKMRIKTLFGSLFIEKVVKNAMQNFYCHKFPKKKRKTKRTWHDTSSKHSCGRSSSVQKSSTTFHSSSKRSSKEKMLQIKFHSLMIQCKGRCKKWYVFTTCDGWFLKVETYTAHDGEKNVEKHAKTLLIYEDVWVE